MYRFDSVYRHYVGGEWVESSSGQTLEVVNPATRRPLARVQSGNAEDVERAVRAARAAGGEWGRSEPSERAELLLEIAARLERRRSELAVAESLNNGRPVFETQAIDLPLAIDQLRYFAAAARVLEGGAAEIPGGLRYSLHEPLGVVGQIIPWNVPLLMGALKIAPALAGGNTVVIKPAEQTPLSLLELVKEIHDLLPPGVLNVVTGLGPECGAPLAGHPDVRKVAFTGETTTGRRILEYAARNIAPATLELGGKGPGIVFPDCDLDRAVEGTIMGFCAFNGEQCLAASRLFLHRRVEKAFLEKLVERVRAIRIGDPLDKETRLGPLVSQQQFDKVLHYVELGRREGARLLCGGGTVRVPGLEDGWFVAPTVFGDVRNDMRIAQEEIFGPVLCVLPWEDEEEMLEQANGVPYGLSAALWTNDLARAHRTARALDAGSVWINRFANVHAGAPFGGYKRSGFGREMAFETLLAYTQRKSVAIDFGHEPLGLY